MKPFQIIACVKNQIRFWLQTFDEFEQLANVLDPVVGERQYTEHIGIEGLLDRRANGLKALQFPRGRGLMNCLNKKQRNPLLSHFGALKLLAISYSGFPQFTKRTRRRIDLIQSYCTSNTLLIATNMAARV